MEKVSLLTTTLASIASCPRRRQDVKIDLIRIKLNLRFESASCYSHGQCHCQKLFNDLKLNYLSKPLRTRSCRS